MEGGRESKLSKGQQWRRESVQKGWLPIREEGPLNRWPENWPLVLKPAEAGSTGPKVVLPPHTDLHANGHKKNPRGPVVGR